MRCLQTVRAALVRPGGAALKQRRAATCAGGARCRLAGHQWVRVVQTAAANRRRIAGDFLTARSNEIDEVVGLELGADDYIAKRFLRAKLVARVRTVLRRVHARA